MSGGGDEIRDRPSMLGLDTRTLRRKVDEQLATTGKIIGALQRELAEARAQNRKLSAESAQLRRSLVKQEVLQLERAELEARMQEFLRRGARLESALRAAEQQNLELAERCAELDRTLAAEIEAHDVAVHEADLLTEQVDELQRIVELLSGGEPTG